MKILALDQASVITGYAILEDGELLEYGTIQAKKSDVFLKRIIYIHEEIIKIIQEQHIDYVIFEDIQLENGNVATFKVLAELYGILDYDFTINNIPHESVLAVEWRAALGIKNTKRTKAKENDIEYVQLKYNMEVVSDDVADAICIGTYYFYKLNNPNDWSD